MPRGRYRDDWSDDSGSDDYRIEKIKKHVSRSRSRHHRSPREEEPVINYFENKLYVPGQERPRERERSSSRHRDYGRESELEALMLARLQLEKDSERKHHDDYEDRDRRRYEDDRRRKELEWEMEDRRRKDERRREDMRRELDREQKRREEEEKEAIEKAEEHERAEKAKRDKFKAEFEAAEAKKAADAKATKDRIILEEQLKKKREEAEEAETKKRILAEVAAEKKKKEDEEKAQKEQFKNWVRENAIKNGLDPDKAVAQLAEGKKPEGHDKQIGIIRKTGLRRKVRVRRDHILPQTLDSYKLSWKYYEDDPDFIVIEDEIDDDFLYELQVDSERIIRSRKLITPGYKKETITTLTPGGSTDAIRKKNGKYYMVRKRSVSRSRFGISDLI